MRRSTRGRLLATLGPRFAGLGIFLKAASAGSGVCAALAFVVMTDILIMSRSRLPAQTRTVIIEAMNSRRSPRPLDTQSPLAGCLLGISYFCVVAAFSGTAWRFRIELSNVLGFGPGVVFGLCFTFFGVFFLFLTAREVGWWWASRRWCTAEAMIVASCVRKDDDGEGGPNLPEITYEFEAMGQRIESDYIRFGGYGHGDAEFLVEFCTPGRLVLIYYDPSNPQRCCLQRIVGGWLTMHVTGAFLYRIGHRFSGAWASITSGVARDRWRPARQNLVLKYPLASKLCLQQLDACRTPRASTANGRTNSNVGTARSPYPGQVYLVFVNEEAVAKAFN